MKEWTLKEYLRNNHKTNKDCGNHNIYPENPAKKCEVGGYNWTKMRFNFFNTHFPWDHVCSHIFQLPFKILPVLCTPKTHIALLHLLFSKSLIKFAFMETLFTLIMTILNLAIMSLVFLEWANLVSSSPSCRLIYSLAWETCIIENLN